MTLGGKRTLFAMFISYRDDFCDTVYHNFIRVLLNHEEGHGVLREQKDIGL